MHASLRSTTFCALIICASLAATPSEAQQGDRPQPGVESPLGTTQFLESPAALEPGTTEDMSEDIGFPSGYFLCSRPSILQRRVPTLWPGFFL